MSFCLNAVRQRFYLDSVALMRYSQQLLALPGVSNAALMIGSPSNKAILQDAGLLAEAGQAASANDLIIAVQADDEATAESALAHAQTLLQQPAAQGQAKSGQRQPRSMSAALQQLPQANLALISVPGEFAAVEARRALHRGLHVMLFSDNISLADELSLKQDAQARGLLLMGPDCGTAILNGAPLAFANVVPRGDIGLIAASGTGLQEVSCLIARLGGGVSHGIGVGGRDLKDDIGAISTLMAFDALEQDPATRHIVLISKPPGQQVIGRLLERIGRSSKPVTVCFMGAETLALPSCATQANTLQEAAEQALGRKVPEAAVPLPAVSQGRRWLRGLYAGGTLCAEAQAILRALPGLQSNVPIPGIVSVDNKPAHSLIDLGADDYTIGRPHPMLDPAIRNLVLAETLQDSSVAVVLLDVVLGYGAHSDPAQGLVSVIRAAPAERPVIIASVTGTDADPQGYSRQKTALSEAGVLVATSNAEAVRWASRVLEHPL